MSFKDHFLFFKNKKQHRFCMCGGVSSFAKTILEKQDFTNIINGGSIDQVSKFVK